MGKFTTIDKMPVNLHGDGGFQDAVAYRIDLLADGQTTDWCARYDIPITPISLTPENMDMQYTFFIPDCGALYFTLGAIWNSLIAPSGKAKALYSIGYKKYFDFVSGSFKLYLCLNNSEGVQITMKEYCLTGPIALRTPWMYDSSIRNWEAINTSLITSGINSGLRLVGLGSQVISSVSAAKDAALLGELAYYDQGGPDISWGWGKSYGDAMMRQLTGKNNMNQGLGIGIQMSSEAVNTIGGAVNNYMNQIWQEENSAASTIGGAGGSVDFIMLPWVVAKHHKAHNIADIQGKFGKPDGLVRVVGNLKGWVKTNACHLPSNGLPFDIISKAEKAADIGFRIVS